MGPAALSIVFALAVGLGSPREPDVWVDREILLMGTWLRAEVEAPAEAEAQRVIDRLFDAVAALEEKWTTLSVGSELSALRSAGLGVAVPLSEDTFELLAQAWSLADRTNGAFEPTVGPLLDVWVGRDDGAEPALGVLERALASVGRRCFDLSPAARTISRYCPDAWIDGGGFGKGAALAVIEDILDEEGITRARIDFGGQLLVRGSDAARSRTIEVADPRERDRVAFEWQVQDGSVATTAQTRHGSTSTDGPRGPVLDPKSGLPVEAWGSVTVRSDDPIEADAIATALFVMGPQDGIRWLAARPDIEAVLLLVRENEVVACGSERLLEVLTSVRSDAVLSAAARISDTLRACPR